MTRKYTFSIYNTNTIQNTTYITLYKDALNQWYYSQYNDPSSRVSITRLSDACRDAENWLCFLMAHAKQVKDQYVNVVGNLCSAKEVS
jgi:hypothetical protein